MLGLDETEGLREPDADASGSAFFRSRWVEPPAGRRGARPRPLAPGFRAGGAALRAQGRRRDRRRPARLRRRGGRLGAAAHPQRLGRGAGARLPRPRSTRGAVRAAVVNAGNANAETGEQGYRRRLRDARRGRASALGLGAASGRRRRDRDDRRAAADRRGPRRDRRGRRRRSREPAAAPFSEAILTTDRWPKRCTRAGRRRHALRPGQGRRDDRAGLRDDALLRADRRRRRGPRRRACARAVDASFERITVDGQMSTNDTVLLQATGAAGAPLPDGPARRGPAAARDRDRRRRRGRRPGSAGSRSPRRRRRRRGRAGRPRDRQLAAGQDRALRPRPELGPDRPGGRAWRSPARTCDELGAERDRRRRARRRRAGGGARPAARPRRAPRPTSGSRDLTYDYVRINAEYTT